MTNQTIRQIYIFLSVLVITTCAYSGPVTRSLCEDRCESSIPKLRNLRIIWNKMSERIGILGNQEMSFEVFVKSLVVASVRHPWLWLIRGQILRLVSSYHDCTKACEHQYSKRTFDGGLQLTLADNSINLRISRWTRRPICI